MTDWDSLFESKLVPLVASANTPEAVDACVSVVIDSLFRRTGDEDSKIYFRKIFDQYVGRAQDFDQRLKYAVDFLRMVKGVRCELSEEARRKEMRKDEVVSSDLVAVARAVPPIVPLPPKPVAPVQPIGFEAIFDDTLCGYFNLLLGKLHSNGSGAHGLPFMLAPDFPAVFERVVRTHVLKSIRSSRHITANLRDSHVWDSGGEKKVMDVLAAGEVNNPILLGWDRRWGELGGKAAGEGDGKAVWSAFAKHAKQHGYLAPKPADIGVLLALPRYSPGHIDKAWGELIHCYEQEFERKPHQAQAREGAFRDALNKWGDRPGMPPHMVEWLAIKASLDLSRLDRDWLEEFSKNKGKTSAERSRNVPYLSSYLSKPKA